jgi:hypothetical protein
MRIKKAEKKFLNEVVKGTWVINSDGKVDVVGSVSIMNLNIPDCKTLPFKFGKITGDFYLRFSNVSSFKNFPDYIENDFWCHNNYSLTSLEHFPEYVGDNIYFGANNGLINYFKTIKEEDFKHWDKVRDIDWVTYLSGGAYNLIKILVKYLPEESIKNYLKYIPKLKLYI